MTRVLDDGEQNTHLIIIVMRGIFNKRNINKVIINANT